MVVQDGESEIKYFAVLRTDKGAFYPDFIIQFKDGRIGIFETKADRTAETTDAKPRAEGLYKYIKAQNKAGKKVFGGIAINKNGSWRYNDNETYVYNENDLRDWTILDI